MYYVDFLQFKMKIDKQLYCYKKYINVKLIEYFCTIYESFRFRQQSISVDILPAIRSIV